MISLFFIEFKRQTIMALRYPVEALAGVVVFTLLFFGLFTGSKFLAAGAPQFSERLDIIVANYVLWLITIGLFAGPGAQLIEDASSGILEQIFVARKSFALFAAVRSFGGLLQHMVLIVIVGLAISLITGSRLSYRIDQLLPFLGVVLAASGLGLSVAAYAMLVKQVGAVLQIGQFLLLALVAAPLSDIDGFGRALAAIAPINPSSRILQLQLVNGYNPTFLEFAVSLINGVAYLLGGVLLLHLASKHAMSRGTVGHF